MIRRQLQALASKGILLGVLLLLCAEAPHLRAQTAVRDSGGVRIVENLTAPDRVISMRSGPALTIGARDDAAFTLIVSIRVLPDGDLAIIDLHDRAIRIFDGQSGVLKKSIGRSGQGPIEFAAAPSIGVTRGGLIRAWDPGNRRATLWDKDGDLLESENLAGQRTAGLPNAFAPGAWTVSPSGLILAIWGRQERSGSGWKATQRMQLFGSGLDQPISVGPEIDLRTAYVDDNYIASPFEFPRRAVLRGEQIIASHWDGSWQLHLYNSDGHLVEIVRSPVPRRAVTHDMVEREREALRGSFEPRVFEALFSAATDADSTSAISGLHASEEGRVWVSRWASPYAAGDALILDVIDVGGDWMGTLRLPPNAGKVMDVSFGRIATVWYDEMRVPYVKVFDLPDDLLSGHERDRG